jgi:transcription initiation factor IIE alpha subunit
MKKLVLLTIAFVTTFSIAVTAQSKAGKVDTARHARIYTCPMHDNIAAAKPGNCPVCGMKLERTKKEALKAAGFNCPVHMNEVSTNPGKCPACGRDLVLTPKEKMKTEAMKLYTCPMHPEVSSDKSGKCPKCGMDLAKSKNKSTRKE